MITCPPIKTSSSVGSGQDGASESITAGSPGSASNGAGFQHMRTPATGTVEVEKSMGDTGSDPGSRKGGRMVDGDHGMVDFLTRPTHFTKAGRIVHQHGN